MSLPRNKHWISESPEYEAWQGMIRRCTNPKRADYPRYGGRGIGVCERWKDSFAAFFEDMGPKPSPTHSLDRIDNKGNYEPNNCRWATLQEQARNKRSNRLITCGDVTLTVTEWAEKTGLSRKTITGRLGRGWSVADTLSTPKRNESRDLVTLNGETMTVSAWSRRTGIKRSTISMRVAMGWTMEAALTTPTRPKRR